MKKQYKIIRVYAPDFLEQMVNDALVNGWELVGGVCVYQDIIGQRNSYAQAVIRLVPGDANKPYAPGLAV